MKKSEVTPQLLAGFLATTSMLCPGYHVAWSSQSLFKLMAEDSDIPITLDQSSWIVSTILIGGMFGSILGALVVDRWGRKLSLFSSLVPYLIGAILIGVAQSFWWFIVARFFAGLGVGLTMTFMPMYLGEIAHDRIRGALVTMFSVMLNAGILLGYCVGPWLSPTAFAGFGGALPLISGLLFIWLPESPYYFIMKNKRDCAEKSLSWLRVKESVSEELNKVQETVEFNKKNTAPAKDLIVIPGNRRALFIVLGMVAAQQLSGINTILAYSTMIFEASGSQLDSSMSVILIGVVQLFSCLLTAFTVDFAGRRLLFLISGCGTIVFLGGEGLYFYLKASGFDVSMISWFPLTGIIGYIIFYVIGLSDVPFIVLSEIFPCNIKAVATMVFLIVGCIAGVIATKMYQIVTDEFGIHVSFWGFALITMLLVIFVYITLPETKQRSFKSIQNELRETTESYN